MFARAEIKPLPEFSFPRDFARVAVVSADNGELRVIARIRPVRESADPAAFAAFAVESSVLKIARAADSAIGNEIGRLNGIYSGFAAIFVIVNANLFYGRIIVRLRAIVNPRRNRGCPPNCRRTPPCR